jgi:hypothetical protein
MTTKTPLTQEQKAAAADDASLFMQELLGSVETLTGIAEEHGPRTLADLMYLQAAILEGGLIENHPEDSAVMQIVSGLPSAARWTKFIGERAGMKTTIIPPPRTPEHQLVFDAMQPMEELGGPSEQDYIAIMQAVSDQVDRNKRMAIGPLEHHHLAPDRRFVIARGSMPFAEVKRALDGIFERQRDGAMGRDIYIAILDAIKGDVETRIENVRQNIQESRYADDCERRLDEASDAAALGPR